MWQNPQVPEDMVTFTEEIFNRKFQFLCSDIWEVTFLPAPLFFPFPIFKVEFIVRLVHNWVCITLFLCIFIDATLFISFYIIANFFIFCLFFCLAYVMVVRVTVQNFIFVTKQVSILELFKSFFVNISMEFIFLMSASICTCLREQYLILCDAY